MRILDVDIYVVVYAVDEEVSFKLAKSIFKQLQEIRRSDSKLRLFYLVGNKTDLVRSRQVTTQSEFHPCLSLYHILIDSLTL